MHRLAVLLLLCLAGCQISEYQRATIRLDELTQLRGLGPDGLMKWAPTWGASTQLIPTTYVRFSMSDGRRSKWVFARDVHIGAEAICVTGSKGLWAIALPRAEIVGVDLATGGVREVGGGIFLGALVAGAAVGSGAVHLSSPFPSDGPPAQRSAEPLAISGNDDLTLEPPDFDGVEYWEAPSLVCQDAVPLFRRPVVRDARWPAPLRPGPDDVMPLSDDP
jgi:hypothetical protein